MNDVERIGWQVSEASLMEEAAEALSPSNARKFDGDSNFKKCLELRVCVVGADDGSPVFLLEAKSPRTRTNNLGFTVKWTTNDREKAAGFLRSLADSIEDGQ